MGETYERVKKYYRSPGKGGTKSQGLFLCPALSQSPRGSCLLATVTLESGCDVTSNAELLGLGMLVTSALGRTLMSPLLSYPSPTLHSSPSGTLTLPSSVVVLDGEEKAQDCRRFHLVDLGGSGLTTWSSSTLSRPGLGPDNQDYYGNPGKSQPLQTFSVSPTFLLAVHSQSSGGFHSWAEEAIYAGQQDTPSLPTPAHAPTHPPRPSSPAEPCWSHNFAGVPLLRKCSCGRGPCCGGQLCAVEACKLH